MTSFAFATGRVREIEGLLASRDDLQLPTTALVGGAEDDRISVRATFAIAGIAFAARGGSLPGFELKPNEPEDLQFAAELLRRAAHPLNG